MINPQNNDLLLTPAPCKMALADGTMADWIGLDEDGAALIKIDGRPVGLTPTEFESVCGPADLHSLKAGA